MSSACVACAADRERELAVARSIEHFAPSAGTGTVPGEGGSSRPADIIELVMEDHRRIRRLREALSDAVRYSGGSGPGWMVAHAWQRLSGLLEVHARAEEEICYLPMFGSSPQAIRRMREAVGDHDDIREAIGEASLQRAGSTLWWRAVRAGLAASSAHLERAERGMLTHCELTASQRLELGRQWSAFIAAWRQDAGPRPAGDPARERPARPSDASS